MKHLKTRLQIFLMTLGLFGLLVIYTNCSEKQLAEGVSEAASLGSEFSGTINGELTVVEKSGLVMGYAYDPKNRDKKMRVHFVADAPGAQGTYLGSTMASLTSPGAFTGSYYTFQIPSSFANGQNHNLYVYGHEVATKNLLYRSPMSFSILLPKAQATFTNSGLGAFVTNTCNACHGWTYRDLFYGPLITPSPFNGGSAINNGLIRKMNGQTGHNGGRFCQANTDFPCSAIQQWWTAEFN